MSDENIIASCDSWMHPQHASVFLDASRRAASLTQYMKLITFIVSLIVASNGLFSVVFFLPCIMREEAQHNMH